MTLGTFMEFCFHTYIEHMSTILTTNHIAPEMYVAPFDLQLLSLDQKAGDFIARFHDETRKG